MRLERLDIAVSYDVAKGWYVATHEQRTFGALSLSGLRQQIEALLPEGVSVTLRLDHTARMERDRRRRGGHGGPEQWRR
jgi:hypothetical protein